jgi:hypothetical protein
MRLARDGEILANEDTIMDASVFVAAAAFGDAVSGNGADVAARQAGTLDRVHLDVGKALELGEVGGPPVAAAHGCTGPLAGSLDDGSQSCRNAHEDVRLAGSIEDQRHEGQTGVDDSDGGLEAGDECCQSHRFGVVVPPIIGRGNHPGQCHGADTGML